MVFELHIWGPAFTLPSIDPQCLAAVAYLVQTVPRHQWVLVASSNEDIGHARVLPALRHDEYTVAGYENIVAHLSALHGGKYNLDTSLDTSNRADAIAFSSHIQTSLLPLLDLSLYVSSENYTDVTRPAYSAFLSWPSPYTIPPSRRALAKSRSSYLGLSSLDLDTTDTDEERRQKHLGESIIPERLRNAPVAQTVTGLLKKERSTARFKLEALVEAACEPLSELLGDKKYFLSDSQPSSLDCLALGYLALAVIPEIPQAWLKEGLVTKYKNLCEYVKRRVKEVFGGPIRVDAALYPASSEQEKDTIHKLPWQTPPAPSTMDKASALARSLTDGLPFTDSKIVTASDADAKAPAHPSMSSAVLPLSIAAAAAAAIGAYMFGPELSSLFGPQEMGNGRQDMGEAGDVLAGLNFGSAPRQSSGPPPREGRLRLGLRSMR
ncbi:uncharacterized protein KY384_001782 [Bacidia gigantensis]|uniref:uncharacterized protein n=1 Tax=Bacidia gigantensis TaxID=2732470 RepID=UPI001D04EE0E|nr:uncharacterized protein KY384_001782 [Bacidia gigantensis]KAG8533000.1 hypothetical protein KY384_001782 [Bacidia gigantensis]